MNGKYVIAGCRSVLVLIDLYDPSLKIYIYKKDSSTFFRNQKIYSTLNCMR